MFQKHSLECDNIWRFKFHVIFAQNKTIDLQLLAIISSSIYSTTHYTFAETSLRSDVQCRRLRTDPSQIFFTLDLSWSPWKNMMKTDLSTWSPCTTAYKLDYGLTLCREIKHWNYFSRWNYFKIISATLNMLKIFISFWNNFGIILFQM